MQDSHEIEAETTLPSITSEASVHIASRIAKLERLRARGIDPYPTRFFRTCDNATAAATFAAIEAGQQPETDGSGLSLAGRIVALRNMGRSAFLDLQDESGSIQVLFRRNNLRRRL